MSGSAEPSGSGRVAGRDTQASSAPPSTAHLRRSAHSGAPARRCTRPGQTLQRTATRGGPHQGWLGLRNPRYRRPGQKVASWACHLQPARDLVAQPRHLHKPRGRPKTPTREHDTNESWLCDAGRSDLVPQERGTSFQGRSLSTRGSPGNPSTRSPRMFFMTSEVPPSMLFARLVRRPAGSFGRSPRRGTAGCAYSHPAAPARRVPAAQA